MSVALFPLSVETVLPFVDIVVYDHIKNIALKNISIGWEFLFIQHL